MSDDISHIWETAVWRNFDFHFFLISTVKLLLLLMHNILLLLGFYRNINVYVHLHNLDFYVLSTLAGEVSLA